MNNSILNDVLKEYEKKRLSNTYKLEKRKQELYTSNPELKEIDNKLSEFSINTAKSILQNNSEKYLKDLKKEVQFLKNKKICEILKTYDIIIPVPIHNKRRKERGYNQSALIAKEFCKNINELEYEDILIKKKNTIAQSTLNKEERLKNAIDMYKIKENKQDIIYNKNVLVFDDIYTTGATANECAKAIRGANSNKIGVLTIAKD
mgnify:CR=1 FL=1